ncbi:MAG TPA: hypothetical protein VMH81_24660 [Bryobacteraceae bacterium]|nr:hypothetical protein [Bryobacteraceae bacterium]
MTIDERLEAIGMHLEVLTRVHHDSENRIRQDIETLIAAARQDGENIRALARIAEIRERRLTALEDGDES